jgi:triosephosphate isomerase
VTAVDFSAGMLDEARRKPGADAICFLQHDVHEKLPFADGEFDLVVSGLVLEHLRTLPAVAARLARGSVVLHAWMYKIESGAYTGEVSAPMLKSMGIPYVILGHSERRQYFSEDGKLLAKKVDISLKHGLTPIFCCGEPLEVRESNGHEALVKKQVEEALFHLGQSAIQKVVIAYEPVWAIGTGKTATSQQAQDMHVVIRKHLAGKYGQSVANEISILYGGSVNAANAKELFACPDVDGGLVGGASLKSREFTEVIKGVG